MNVNNQHYQMIILNTERGDIDCRYYNFCSPIHNHKKDTIKQKEQRAAGAVIFVTGIGGDWV